MGNHSHLPLLLELVGAVSQDQEGNQLLRSFWNKMFISIFLQHKIVKLCLWQPKKIPAHTTLPAGQEQACPDPTATMARALMTCNALVRIFPSCSLLVLLGSWYVEDVHVLGSVYTSELVVTVAETAAPANA